MIIGHLKTLVTKIKCSVLVGSTHCMHLDSCPSMSVAMHLGFSTCLDPAQPKCFCLFLIQHGESQRVTDIHQLPAAPVLRHEIQREGRTAMAPDLSPLFLYCNSNKNATAKLRGFCQSEILFRNNAPIRCILLYTFKLL